MAKAVYVNKDVTKIITIDIRDRIEYDVQHIAWAINIPATEILEQDLSLLFQQYYIPEIINSINDCNSRTTEQKKDKPIYVQLYFNKKQSKSVQAITSKIRDYLKSYTFKNSNNASTFMLEGLPEAMSGLNYKMFGGLSSDNSANIVNENDSVVILGGNIAIFNESNYFQEMKDKMKSKILNNSNQPTTISEFSVVFDFAPINNIQFPEFMNLVNRSVGKPKVLCSSPSSENKINQLMNIENGEYFEFTFPNGFSIEWNYIPIINIEQTTDEEFASIIRFIIDLMEPYQMFQRRSIGILWNDFAIPSILCLLVGINKWTVIKAYNYLLKTIPPHKFFSSILVRCVRILLTEYEFYTSLYTYPSLSLKLVVTHQLKMENVKDMILYQKLLPFNTEAKLKRKRLFQYLKDRDMNEVEELLKSNGSLIKSRLSFRKNDLTPLLYLLSSSKQSPSIKDLKSVTDKISVTMKSANNEDVLYYALSYDTEIIQFLIENGALIGCSSTSTNQVPLQTAIEKALPLKVLLLLMNEQTVNHKDIESKTPLHYLLTSNYAFEEKLKIIETLVMNGANMYLEDIKKFTPMSLALHLSSDPENQDHENYDKIYKHFHNLSINEGFFEENASFAPFRDNINVKMLVDGEEYFLEVAIAIFRAKKMIYIADWWLSPHLQLFKPSTLKNMQIPHSLDNLLAEVAKRGVEVYIILWDNVEVAVPIKNQHAASVLESIHPNIRVLTHTSSLSSSWSHHQKIVVIDEYLAFLGGLDLCFHRWDTTEHKIIDPEKKYFVGKDYFVNEFDVGEDLDDPFSDYKKIDRLKHCRLGWHDVSLSVDGLAAADVAKNFVQRWTFIMEYKNVKIPKWRLTAPAMNNVDNSNSNILESASTSKCQIVRSISNWSAGIKTKESSIFNAMLKEIEEAEEFIYIENQFFISIPQSPDLADSQGHLKNIGDALINRIKKAFTTSSPFKVIVVIPEHPEGDPANNFFIQRTMFWQMKTIFYIINEVNEFTSMTLRSCDDYISFHSLRNHDVLNGIPVSEQIYIHAKLMITDKAIICGSANINLRSLCGDRDSEIAAVVHNPTLCNQLRKRLWREHLGETANITDNFIADSKIWKRYSRKNTKYYKNLFQLSIPLGQAKDNSTYLSSKKLYFDKMSNRSEEIKREIIAEQMSTIRGHVVDYPLRFLQNNLLDTEFVQINFNSYVTFPRMVLLKLSDKLYQ